MKSGFAESFEALYREKKYPHAFIIASKYPELKETAEYAKMQKHFHTLLRLAALQIKKGETYKAEELIGEYARVEEKRVVVKLLLAYGEEFLSFLKALNDAEFERVFATLQLHPDFAKVPSFVALKMRMQERLALLEKRMDAMELDSDFSLLQEWERYLPEAKRLQRKLATLQKLQYHYEKEEWSECYDLIEQEESVKNSLLAQLLQKHWYKRFEQAKEAAQNGIIERVYEVLHDFVEVTSKKEQIKQLLYIAAKRRIAKLLETQAYNETERLLFETAEHFGKDMELLELAKDYHKQTGIKVVFG